MDTFISPDKAIISIQALSGILSLQMKKINSYIKHHALVRLIDSGSTHNFINRSMSKDIHYFIHLVNNFEILIVNGGMIKCVCCFENAKLQMGDYHLKTQMFSINIGGFYIVLGDEWLRTLGSITMYFKGLLA